MEPSDTFPQPAEDLGLLTVPEAARLLRISRNLAYELVAQRQIPALRLGRAIRVPRHALIEWIVRSADTPFAGQDGNVARQAPARTVETAAASVARPQRWRP
jgi:excisionase family DNA binding protein